MSKQDGAGSPFGERPWSSYAPGVPLDVAIPTESLPEMLALSVQRYGTTVALDFFGAETTYADMADQVRCRRGLRAVRALARERLAAYKVPRRVVIVAELPRSQIGKVLRRHVRDRIEASAEHASAPDHG